MKFFLPVILVACLISCTTQGMWGLLNFPTKMEERRKKINKCKNVYPGIFETKDDTVTFEGLIYSRIPLPTKNEWERIALIRSYKGLAQYTIELQRQEVYGYESKGITHDYVEFSHGYALTKKGKITALAGSILLLAYAIKLALVDDEL